MTANRNDPWLVFAFGVKLETSGRTLQYGDGTAFFKSVSGLKCETETQDYPEGGCNTFVHKLVGVTKWPNIVLKQGFTGDDTLWSWKQKMTRKNGIIFQLGPDNTAICKWTFKNGFPVKWEGPEYDATKNELAIETIEIAHEGLEYSASA
jgi:phage tail-like protein